MFLIVEIRKIKDYQDIDKLIKSCDHLQQKIRNIRICELITSNEIFYIGKFDYSDKIKLKIIYYKNRQEIEVKDNFTCVKMPYVKFRNMYDALILDEEIKIRVLRHFYKIYYITKKKYEFGAFDINKTGLFYGPPGTGKTTLAKGIFYRFSIRMKGEVNFIEIGCTKLFSKFYGETLNSLLNLKREISQMSENKILLILFDEIESILISRDIIVNHNEPLESARLVNSFLLLLDEFKTNANIFFIFTSNNYDKLDAAFLDRCDLKILIDIPDTNTIYSLLCNLFKILIKQGLVASTELEKSVKIHEVSKLLHGKSSRQITKMVFEAINIKFNTVEDILIKIKHQI